MPPVPSSKTRRFTSGSFFPRTAFRLWRCERKKGTRKKQILVINQVCFSRASAERPKWLFNLRMRLPILGPPMGRSHFQRCAETKSRRKTAPAARQLRSAGTRSAERLQQETKPSASEREKKKNYLPFHEQDLSQFFSLISTRVSMPRRKKSKVTSQRSFKPI